MTTKNMRMGMTMMRKMRKATVKRMMMKKTASEMPKQMQPCEYLVCFKVSDSIQGSNSFIY